MTHSAAPHAPLLERLLGHLSTGRLYTHDSEREFYSADLFTRGERCAAAVAPGTTEETRALVAACTELGYAVVPRGGGLTYVGGYTPPGERSVVFDMRQMNRILNINPEDMYIQVEAGVTWKQIHEALAPHGLRLPFLGTFSGAAATVGGGLSNGALFFGSARYGTAAELVMGIEAVTASGERLLTGQMAVTKCSKPAYRTFGPDLSGLLIHDSGALAIKTAATLRVIHRPEYNGFASFGFARHSDAIATLSEIGRRDLAEEAYVMDPQKTRDALTTSGLASDIKTLWRVIGEETSLLRGLKAGLTLGLSGRRFANRPLHSLHMTCSARSRRGLQDDLARAAAIANRHDGINLPDSIPRAARASLFPPLEGIMGPAGERWVALNAKVAHSDGVELYNRAEAVINQHANQLQQHGIQVSRLLAVLSNHSFSYEPVLHWKDSWLPMHREAPQVTQGLLEEPDDNPKTRAIAHQVRAELIDVFTEMGAASNQIGRTYPYLSVLHPETGKLLRQLKRTLDPRGLMNPGVLELD